MDELQLGKDLANFESRQATTEQLVQEIYSVLEYNLANKKLEAPKEEKKKV